VIAPPPPAPVVVAQPAPKPVVAVKQITARTNAGSRINRLPSSALARLRRGQPGISKALAHELAKGTRALDRGLAYTAYSHFLQALRYDAKSTDALMGVALCHYELDQRGATKRALAKVFALDANHPEASILSGFVAQLAGKSDAAVEWYQRALVRIDDDEVAAELRSVVAQLQTSSSDAPTATAAK
jgi:tetratricopeptide (TPR) repeat protein